MMTGDILVYFIYGWNIPFGIKENTLHANQD